MLSSIYDMKNEENQRKVLIFKINLCDKIFSYSSAYALMLESISEALSSFVVSAPRKRGSERTEKGEKRERACFYCPFRLNISHHTLTEGIIPPHWYLSICGNYIFSCRFLLNGRFLILYICAAGSVLVLSNMNSHCKHLSRQWTMAKSRDDDFC
jgi:hypothetical protein